GRLRLGGGGVAHRRIHQRRALLVDDLQLLQLHHELQAALVLLGGLLVGPGDHAALVDRPLGGHDVDDRAVPLQGADLLQHRGGIAGCLAGGVGGAGQQPGHGCRTARQPADGRAHPKTCPDADAKSGQRAGRFAGLGTRHPERVVANTNGHGQPQWPDYGVIVADRAVLYGKFSDLGLQLGRFLQHRIDVHAADGRLRARENPYHAHRTGVLRSLTALSAARCSAFSTPRCPAASTAAGSLAPRASTVMWFSVWMLGAGGGAKPGMPSAPYHTSSAGTLSPCPPRKPQRWSWSCQGAHACPRKPGFSCENW